MKRNPSTIGKRKIKFKPIKNDAINQTIQHYRPAEIKKNKKNILIKFISKTIVVYTVNEYT